MPETSAVSPTIQELAAAVEFLKGERCYRPREEPEQQRAIVEAIAPRWLSAPPTISHHHHEVTSYIQEVAKFGEVRTRAVEQASDEYDSLGTGRIFCSLRAWTAQSLPTQKE